MPNSETNIQKLNFLLDKYHLRPAERKELLDMIIPLFSHDEFQKRMQSPYFHHGKITLGEHILEDTIVTYKLSKEYLNNHNNPSFNIEIAIKIAMLHDLYTYPWQNNPHIKVQKIYNKHGFRHPIEATINASNWFPDLFKDPTETGKIVDGIIHHMYPLPVRRYDRNNFEKMELNNSNLITNIGENVSSALDASTCHVKFGPFSFRRNVCLEGKIMRKADRIVSLSNFRSENSLISIFALITGNNRNLKN